MPAVFPKILVVPGLPQDIRVILPLRSFFDASNGEELRKEVFRIASSAFEFLISISGLVVEYIVAYHDPVRFPADASCLQSTALLCHSRDVRHQLVHHQGKIAR